MGRRANVVSRRLVRKGTPRAASIADVDVTIRPKSVRSLKLVAERLRRYEGRRPGRGALPVPL